MKIGIFTDSYLPTPTGVAVSVETFRKSLEQSGHDVYIFAPQFKDYKDQISGVYRFPSFFIPIRKDAPIVWPFINFDIDTIKKMNLDIIHTMHFFTIGTFGLKVAKKLDIPLVHTYHTNYEEYAKNYVPGFFVPIAKKYLISRSKNYCNKCDLIISPSPSMARQIRSYGVTTKIEPLPTGINPEEFKPISNIEFRKKYKIRKDGKLLLFVGRLGEEKNISFLIDSFVKVLAKVDANLVLIGSGPSVDLYKNTVKAKGIKDKVYFLGFLPKKEVNASYGTCDVFSFPSVTETQGIVVIEAMAGGLVPVAINKLGPSDIITNGKDGVLCAPSGDEFANNIVKVLSDDNLRKELSQNAIKTAQSYSQISITKKLLELYKQAEVNHKNTSK